ncbi:AlpA family transcriptional regulator [Deefgea sp. CFH1-16]|uniref:helix-turn-helix transcriptional regulator n=1 Tax=Deefgea sp. CFH1-16 TaxID=2675457 RepID=UPI0015F3E154|nr:AlpA family phage regulatory protein [Deefgea sp. CFH1-16]MBM5573692.1 AlpA family phage regulatory protein [Deefgea sp. CFH1-16]
MKHQNLDEYIHLLRRPLVENITGLGRSAIYALVAQGDFPAPVRLTAKSVAWRSDEVQAWVNSRPSTKS